MFFRGWVFHSRWLNSVSPIIDSHAVRRIPSALFSLIFPDECRVCGAALEEISRVPVCQSCLESPRPLVADCFCSSCGTPFLNGSPLDANGCCSLCRRGLTRFDAAFSYGEYDGTLRELIHLYKYGRVRPLERPLGRLLLRALPRSQRFDVVVPVPLHWWRRLTRGFNQSELLARHVAKHLNAPLRRGLARTRSTGAQAGLTNAQRRENVAGAFRIRDAKAVHGRHVLLVDDVLTTGATLNAAAGTLKRAGARRVSIVTLARADRRKTAFTLWELDSSSCNSRERSE